jgi:hypothetical protein
MVQPIQCPVRWLRPVSSALPRPGLGLQASLRPRSPSLGHPPGLLGPRWARRRAWPGPRMVVMVAGLATVVAMACLAMRIRDPGVGSALDGAGEAAGAVAELGGTGTMPPACLAGRGSGRPGVCRRQHMARTLHRRPRSRRWSFSRRRLGGCNNNWMVSASGSRNLNRKRSRAGQWSASGRVTSPYTSPDVCHPRCLPSAMSAIRDVCHPHPPRGPNRVGALRGLRPMDKSDYTFHQEECK